MATCTRTLALTAVGFGLLAAALASSPSALAAPTPMAHDESAIYNDTYNNYTTAEDITVNQTERLLYFMDAALNDYDYLTMDVAAGMDLVILLELDPIAQAVRFDGTLKTPEHFTVAYTPNMGPQGGPLAYWFNTTTGVSGQYYLILGRGNIISEYYNITWTATPTAAPDDGDNSLSAALNVTGGPTVSTTVTETTDHADFFMFYASFVPPPYLYLQLTVSGCPGTTPFVLEFYNSTGVALEDPEPISQYSNTANTACDLAVPNSYRIENSGRYYLRLWTGGTDRSYTISFDLLFYSPSRPTCNLNLVTTCVVTDNSVVAGSANALNYSFERSQFFRIFIAQNQTIWVNATSTQIDILARLWSQPADASPPQQKGFSSRAFTGPEDVEAFSYRMTPSELASTTGWYFVEVRITSDLPPDGLYTLRVWLNDRPLPLNGTLTLNEDVPLAGFDLNTLFYDIDCQLGDAADCTARVAMLLPAPSNITFDFDGVRLVNISSTANWSGSGCRQFQGFDSKNLTTTATLCVNVLAVNDPPTVLSPPAQTARAMTEDLTLAAVLVASWFTDADGDTLTYAVFGNDNITVTIDQQNGLFDFDPELNFNGINNLQFEACDTNATCVTWDMVFTVNPVNDIPTARGTLPSVTIPEDSARTMDLANVLILGVLGPACTDVDANSTLTYRVFNTEADLDVTLLGSVLTIRPLPDKAGIYFFEVACWDGFVESFRAFVSVTVTPINDAPVIVAVTPATNPTVAEGESRAFTVTASDVDGDTLTYQWFEQAVGINNEVFAAYTATTQVTNVGNRSVIIKVNVSDGEGGYAEREWTLSITNTNQWPTVSITAPIATERTVAEGEEISFSGTATDPDGDTLTWLWSSNKVFAAIGNEQTITVTLAPGTHEITVKVTDGNGGEARTNITLIVTPKAGDGGGDNTMLIVGAVAVAAIGAVAVMVMRRRKTP